MQAEQQQRILGYFIEEAQDHLNTIEQGLLNLQSTIEDPDLLYEVYRAAHSVKGGAAMLGLNSIQTTAHRLEDSFKILEKIQAQTKVQVEQELESLFLEVFDTLKALTESLSSPYGLTDEVAQSLIQKVEPTFENLNTYLESLAKHNEIVLTELTLVNAQKFVAASTQKSTETPPKVTKTIEKLHENSAQDLFFHSDVTDQMREMLQLFKQSETSSNRQALAEICRSLARAGETFDLSQWTKFIESIEQVIINPQNTYNTLAPIVIKSIKKAQDLVLENRESEIIVDDTIKKLLPAPSKTKKKRQQALTKSLKTASPKSQVPAAAQSEKTVDLTSQNSSSKAAPKLEKTRHLDQDPQVDPLSLFDDLPSSESTDTSHKSAPRGPEMAPEELKSLAALFEGEASIEQTWQEETLIESSESVSAGTSEADLEDDFLDLFGDQSESQPTPTSKTVQPSHSSEISSSDEWPEFWQDAPSSPVPTPQSSKHSSVESDPEIDLDDLLKIGTTSQPDSRSTQVQSETEEVVWPEESDPLNFEDLFGALESEAELKDSPDSTSSSSSSEERDWFEHLIQPEPQATSAPAEEPASNATPALNSAEPSNVDESASEDLFHELFGDLETEETASAPAQTAATTESSNQNWLELEEWLHQDELSSTASELDPAAEAEDLFSNLDALLQEEESSNSTPSEDHEAEEDSDFSELEVMLRGEDSPGSIVRRTSGKPQRIFEPTAKVSVKQLDNLSNLMGELVVNRNSLEQDQDRMRQFLDNLLDQVSLLSDVGQRMQDFYERSLLEISLLSNTRKHSSLWNLGSHGSLDHKPQKLHSDDPLSRLSEEFESTELDRFTPFHTLSQEIIELVVRVRESAADIEFLVEEADQVTRQLRQVTNQLEEGLTKARMEPFSKEADRLQRPVRDISIKCGKQAELHVEGRETLIDKTLLEKLHDPLIHLVNNAITHGIEPADVRQSLGKSPTGRIQIKVFHQGNQTVISIADDGAGINTQRVKEKAIRKGLITLDQAQAMSNLDVYDLLFHPGFSMKDQADEFAGRGVGMDVVRTSLTEIRGTITTDSTVSQGTTFTIRLPLNLSISRALCCISDRARIAFPMDGVEEMIDVPREQIRVTSDGKQAIEWRGSILPFRQLQELLTYKRHLGRGNVYGTNTEEDMISVIVLRSAGNYLAVMVDQVLAEQEIVIKQLEGPVPKPVGVAGATVLGDGQIVAIADVLELIDLAMGRIRKEASPWPIGLSNSGNEPEQPQQQSQPTVLIVDDSITVRSLLSITFEKSGYRVEEARDGKEAWEKLKSGLPCDLVFCDIEMPRMDGLELLSRMQKDPVLCDLAIAMLTSRGADRHRQMAYQLGANGYFTKPYLEEQLLEAAQRMLKGEVVGKPTENPA